MSTTEQGAASTTAAARPLQSRDFRWLLAGRGIDSLGNAMYPVGLGFGMLRLFDSVAALGLVVGAGSLGLVAFLLLGGVLADRLPRRQVLVTSNLLAAVAQAGIVAMVVADLRNLPALVVLSFVTGAAAAFDGPASTALTPSTLPPEALHRGNAMLATARQASRIGGAAGAGLITAFAGPVSVLVVNAVTFAAAGLCFARITTGTRPLRSEASTPLADLAEGWAEFRARTWVVVVASSFFVVNAVWMGAFLVLGVVISEDTIGPDGWGLVLASEGVGAILGGVLANRWQPSRPMLAAMLAATGSMLPVFVLGWWPNLPALLASGVVGGVGIMLFDVAWDTALQAHIPAERLARVSSWDLLFSVAAMPIGSFVVAPLGEAFGTTTVVRGAAVLAVVATLATLTSRDVRELR